MNMLDIEREDFLLIWLRDHGYIGREESCRVRILAGGVSNKTVQVDRPGAPGLVVKQALEKLRVAADWHCDVARIHREALGLRLLHEIAPPGTIPDFVFEDEPNHLLGMRAVPAPHRNWKEVLLAGEVVRDHVEQFAALLGTIHRAGLPRAAELKVSLGDRSFFEALRVEPYYRYAATRQTAAAAFIADLIADMEATNLTVVHGDYSPKNILVHDGRLILLDHEVIHFGDPTFDLGFALTHLLSKANHASAHPPVSAAFLAAASAFWHVYAATAPEIVAIPSLESRAVRQTLACLLARVDGRSPLEYLTPEERTRQRDAILRLMSNPPKTVDALVGMLFG